VPCELAKDIITRIKFTLYRVRANADSTTAQKTKAQQWISYLYLGVRLLAGGVCGSQAMCPAAGARAASRIKATHVHIHSASFSLSLFLYFRAFNSCVVWRVRARVSSCRLVRAPFSSLSAASSAAASESTGGPCVPPRSGKSLEDGKRAHKRHACSSGKKQGPGNKGGGSSFHKPPASG
jgi:hypothetical protein